MSDNLSKTVHGDFDAVFREVTQSCPVSWITQGELRLFHLNIRNNKFNPEEMKKLLYTVLVDMNLLVQIQMRRKKKRCWMI